MSEDKNTTALTNAVAALMNVKSLVTIALTIGFIVMAVRGTLTAEYQSVYLVVISFYFGTQYQKAKEAQDNASAGQSNVYRS